METVSGMRIYTGDVRWHLTEKMDRVWDTRLGAPNIICDIAHEYAVRAQQGLLPMDKLIHGRDDREYIKQK